MEMTSGTLISQAISTASSPAVNYVASYAASRASSSTAAVSVAVAVSARLNSSGSKLGTGIQLTVFARVNGGAWQSAVIKGNAETWSGTERHMTSLTLPVNTTANAAKVELYVSRTGSSYSGSAGILGSAANPKSGVASLPAYTAPSTGNTSDSTSGNTSGGSSSGSTSDSKYCYVRVNGVWKKAVPYVKMNGIWKEAAPYVRVGGVWKAT